MFAFVFSATLLASLAVPCRGEAPRCLVDVQMGYTRLALQLDTGADIVLLSAAAARQAGVSSGGPSLILQGVNGRSMARIARVKIKVGDFVEEDVLVAIDPRYANGHGLLGMSFLERFRTELGVQEVNLIPIDQNEMPKKGGRGQSWWSLRFRQNQRRMQLYERLLPAVEARDQAAADTYGEAPGELTGSAMVQALHAFMSEERERLDNEAARHAVPREWRR